MTTETHLPETKDETSRLDLLKQVVADLDAGNQETLTAALEEAHASEVANLIKSLPQEKRSELWESVPEDKEADVLIYMHDEARASVIDEMEEHELVAAAESMSPEDLAEIFIDLPQDRSITLLEALDNDHRSRLEYVLNFAEYCAG